MKRFALVAGFMFVLASASVHAQGPSKQATEKWNTPVVQDRRAYAGLKSEPAPKHDLTGVWD